MKTTVEIADPLFRDVRAFCAKRGMSFRQVVESGLRLAIEDAAPRSRRPFRLRPFGFKGKGQLVTDWSSIREMIYEGRGGTPDAPAK